MDLSLIRRILISSTFFAIQRRLEIERNIKTKLQECGSLKDTAGSNIGFLNFLVIPLYAGISELEPRFKELLDRILENKGHWQAVLNE